MKWKYYGKLIRTETDKRSDISSLFTNPVVFSNLIKDLIRPFRETDFNKIVAIDSLGFVLGGAMAVKTKKPLIMARKSGKFPLNPINLIRSTFVDYTKTEKSLEMDKNSIKNGDKIIIVDEWIETGSQVKAVIGMIEQQGGAVVGISAINADKNDNTDAFFDKYNCRPIHVNVQKSKN